MKTGKKALLLALCAVLLVAASVLGTMAYLTSSDTVTNTFTVGDVKIKLDEAKVNADGTVIEDANRVKENEYKLLPGHEYTKDPAIHVASTSEDCYLFVKIDNKIAGIEAEGKTVADQIVAKGWQLVNKTGDVSIYVYIGTAEGASSPLAVSANAEVGTFEKITIKGDVDNTTLATYKDMTITVKAYAVQKDGFTGKNATEIWNTAIHDPAITIVTG